MKFNDIDYEIITNEKEAIDKEVLEEKITDYFKSFDYIVGDWAYGKLRLKGFLDEKNKLVKDFNNIKFLDKYLKDNCAHGCKYFVLKKIEK